MIYHYENRISRLIGALRVIAAGGINQQCVASFAAQAIDTDAKIAEQYRREIRGGAGED